MTRQQQATLQESFLARRDKVIHSCIKGKKQGRISINIFYKHKVCWVGYTMSIKHLIYRNLKKNLKNYYLYVFALIFSVALYFAFVTLQYDPSMDQMKETLEGEAAVKAGSMLLLFIVGVLVLYANNSFIPRRSKEIRLCQLIGMTQWKIFLILSAENLILYFGSLIIGIFIGFSVSKLINMILLTMTGIEAVATLSFSPDAWMQTMVVFIIIYIFIMLVNFIFLKRQRDRKSVV